MSETCRGHLWDKIIIKLFASSWYIFLTYSVCPETFSFWSTRHHQWDNTFSALLVVMMIKWIGWYVYCTEGTLCIAGLSYGWMIMQYVHDEYCYTEIHAVILVNNIRSTDVFWQLQRHLHVTWGAAPMTFVSHNCTIAIRVVQQLTRYCTRTCTDLSDVLEILFNS